MIRFFLIIAFVFTLTSMIFFSGKTKCISQQHTAKFAITLVDTIIKIDARPDLGFNFSYYLRIPKGLDELEVQYLLVETNNSGTNDTMLHHEKETFFETTRGSLGGSLCSRLKLPFLMPIFPRPAKEWQIYTHAFDRDAAIIKKGQMKRLDLQLIAMIENAKTVLKQRGIATKAKILMNGFSASGTFCNRFTLIHPTLVVGTACGGINGFPILCTDDLEGTKLKYPLGTSDFKDLFGSEPDLDAYKKVPQFIYMGENDTNDAVLFDDAYDKSERKIIFNVIGKQMVPDRFRKCESVYNQNKVNSIFKIYPGIGHETDRKVSDDVVNFFSKIMQ